MADIFTKAKPGRKLWHVSARTGNKSTELRFITLMRAAGITGWRRRQKLHGSPDFVFQAAATRHFRGRLLLAWSPQALCEAPSHAGHQSVVLGCKNIAQLQT